MPRRFAVVALLFIAAPVAAGPAPGLGPLDARWSARATHKGIGKLLRCVTEAKETCPDEKAIRAAGLWQLAKQLSLVSDDQLANALEAGLAEAALTPIPRTACAQPIAARVLRLYEADRCVVVTGESMSWEAGTARDVEKQLGARGVPTELADRFAKSLGGVKGTIRRTDGKLVCADGPELVGADLELYEIASKAPAVGFSLLCDEPSH